MAGDTLTGDQFGPAHSYEVKLSPVADQQLHELAERAGTSPDRLVREWVQQRLAWEADQELGQ